MLEIEYKGGNSVILSTRKTTLVADPKLSVVGLKDLMLKGAVELATEERLAVNGENARLAIEGPGDYEVGDFSIKGHPAARHIDTEDDEPLSTIYRIEASDVVVALLGNIAGNLNEEQLEALGVVDVLILPVGGSGYTLDATAAADITRHIDPKVVIPIHYADSSLKYEVPQSDLETFKKELGAPAETVSKYKIKTPSALPQVLTLIEVTRTS